MNYPDVIISQNFQGVSSNTSSPKAEQFSSFVLENTSK